MAAQDGGEFALVNPHDRIFGPHRHHRPLVVRVLRRFANSLQMLDLSDADRAHVDAFAAKVDGASAI